jgi:hypothetical protein
MSETLVSPADVKAILPTLDSRIDPTPFITTAHLMLTRVLINTNKMLTSTGEQDTELQTEIEKWLAAHFCAVADPIHSSESGVGVSASRALPSMGDGLDSTMPGKQVLALDYTGLLNLAFLRKRPIVFAVFGSGADDTNQSSE